MPDSSTQLSSSIPLLLRGLTQLVYPNTCWVCGDVMPPEQVHVCATCLPALTIDPFPTCPRCSSTVGPHAVVEDGCPDCRDKTFAFDGAFRMAPYEGLLRDVVLRMKHWAGEDLAEVMAGLWAKRMAEHVRALNAAAVIPVPLHWRRHWWRGFNACEILARYLADELGVAYGPRVLRRSKATAPQSHQQSATARLENVKHAFEAPGSADLRDKTLLLVDDVLTTGATANEAARALRVHEPAAIYVVVLAHGR